MHRCPAWQVQAGRRSSRASQRSARLEDGLLSLVSRQAESLAAATRSHLGCEVAQATVSWLALSLRVGDRKVLPVFSVYLSTET